MDEMQSYRTKSIKALLRLYRKVLHNVNNEIVYLDELTYTTSRKHLSDLVNSLVEYETNIDCRKFNDKLAHFSLLESNLKCLYQYDEQDLYAGR